MWERNWANFEFKVIIVDAEKEHPTSMKYGSTNNQQSKNDKNTD
jgi:hypothetical protein